MQYPKLTLEQAKLVANLAASIDTMREALKHTAFGTELAAMYSVALDALIDEREKLLQSVFGEERAAAEPSLADTLTRLLKSLPKDLLYAGKPDNDDDGWYSVTVGTDPGDTHYEGCLLMVNGNPNLHPQPEQAAKDTAELVCFVQQHGEMLAALLRAAEKSNV